MYDYSERLKMSMLVLEPSEENTPLPAGFLNYTFNYQSQKASEKMLSQEGKIESLQIFQDIFKQSEFILATYDSLSSVMSSPAIELLLSDVHTVIVDDAHS
jgi:hypothetical protein